MSAILHRLQQFSRAFRSDCGASAVELAVALPLLAVVLLGTIDFGRLFYRTMAVTHATRAGATYGSQSVGNASNHPGVEAAAVAAATDIPTGYTATASHFCTCYLGVAAVENAIACTASCAGQRRVYTQVIGTATFTTVVQYPGMPHTVPISRTVQMRAQ
jgi:Flp pilus assembly protein TadG